MINNEISEQFLKNGVVLLKNIINQNWVEELRRELILTLKNQANINVSMKKKRERHIL